tara:strand:+ start:549 stop:752 length:204 start_codon:yes stop_codon:yes gene_type:complete
MRYFHKTEILFLNALLDELLSVGVANADGVQEGVHSCPAFRALKEGGVLGIVDLVLPCFLDDIKFQV